jgi:hypothetical protein
LQQEIPPSTLQITRIAGEIGGFLEQQLLPTGELELPASINNKMRSYLTEIHRRLKLLQRNLIYWQTAKQPQVRDRHYTAILADLEAITQFTQSMIEELTISIDL